MKKNAVFFLSVLLMMSVCGTAFAGGGKEQGKSLDTAIAEAASEIEAEIEKGAKVAPFSFNSPADQFSEYVLEELSADLVKGKKLVIVDRANLDSIRSELDFNLSGEVDDKAAQEAGRMLGAQVIVTGSLTNIGDTYRLALRAITVESAEVVVLYRSDIANDSRVKALLAGGKSIRTAAPTIADGKPGTQTPVVVSTYGGGGNAGAAPIQAAPTYSGSGNTATPIVVERAPAPAAETPIPNGTYTYYPRLRSMQGGVDKDAYIAKIVVRGGYLNVYISNVPQGVGGYYSIAGFGGWGNALLQDLDNPSKIYNPVTSTSDSDTQCMIVSYQGVTARRFSITTDDRPPFIFDEVVIGTPDR
jgi:TolB-like protein